MMNRSGSTDPFLQIRIVSLPKARAALAQGWTEPVRNGQIINSELGAFDLFEALLKELGGALISAWKKDSGHSLVGRIDRLERLWF